MKADSLLATKLPNLQGRNLEVSFVAFIFGYSEEI